MSDIPLHHGFGAFTDSELEKLRADVAAEMQQRKERRDLEEQKRCEYYALSFFNSHWMLNNLSNADHMREALAAKFRVARAEACRP